MEPGLSSRTAFRPAPAAVQLACSFILLNSAPLVNARDPFEIRFYSHEIIPLSIGVPSRKAISPPLFYPSLLLFGWFFSLTLGCLPFLRAVRPARRLSFFPSLVATHGTHTTDGLCAFHSLPHVRNGQGRNIYQRAVICLLAIRGRRNGPSSWPRILWARSWQKAFRVETPVSNSS